MFRELGGIAVLSCGNDFSGGDVRGRDVTSDRKDATDLPEVSAHGFSRGLGLFDSTMIVAGSMIGSAIFIVSADMSRQLGSSDRKSVV